MNSDRDPIVAIATAPGRGGIGVVRVSGRELAPVVDALLGAPAAALQPRRALHAAFLDAEGRALDDGLALLFPAPHSYTGETVLELQGHSGPVVLQLLVERCLQAGRWSMSMSPECRPPTSRSRAMWWCLRAQCR